MAEGAGNIQCLRFPTLRASKLLAVLRALAEEDFATLIASELRIAKVTDQSWRILLPVRTKGISQDARTAFIDKLKLAYMTEADTSVGREAEQGVSVPLAGTLGPVEAAFALVMASGADEPEHEPRPDAEQVIAVFGAPEDVAGILADVVRLGRDVRTAGAQRLGDKERGAFLIYTDSAEDYGAVSAYFRRDGNPARTFVLRAVDLGFAKLWLRQDVYRPAQQNLNDLASFLLQARGADQFPDTISDVVALQFGDADIRVFCQTTETISAAPSAAEHIAKDLEPIQPVDVTLVAFKPDEVASTELRDHIKALNKEVGYRVSLQPKPPGVAKGVDLEPLLEKIDELQLQIDQITALGAPQRRLMRFNHTQLPAMIDGLRKLPPQKLMDKSLKYAASHSALRGEPVHYLLYDPSWTHMRLSEVQWRMKTDSHPMSYWLEPFVAEAQLRRPTKTQVFVPAGSFLVPSLAHFGGDVDETLRLVLGNLFDDQQPLIKDKDRSAFYVFTKSASEEFRLDVEVLDGDAFAGLQQQLYWINDYLQVQSPIAIEAERLAEVADALYEGEAAKALTQDIDAQIADLDTVWSDASAAITTQALNVIEAITTEMDEVAARIADLHSYLGQAGTDMRALESTAGAALNAVRGANTVMDALGEQDGKIATARMTFESRMDAEFRLAEAAIEDKQARIKALQERLRKIQDWGAS